MLNEMYSEGKWLRMYTYGSKIDRAGTYCRLFSQCVPVGRQKTNTDGKIEAIFLALQQLLYRPNSFHKAVVLVDSQATIKGVYFNKQTQ